MFGQLHKQCVRARAITRYLFHEISYAYDPASSAQVSSRGCATFAWSGGGRGGRAAHVGVCRAANREVHVTHRAEQHISSPHGGNRATYGALGSISRAQLAGGGAAWSSQSALKSTLAGSVSGVTLQAAAEQAGAWQRTAVGTWLAAITVATGGLMVFGGITRLTRSGLSMTDWKFTGERPPLTEADWEAEFARYQQFPEFIYTNSHMTLDDFKRIYWVEWAHRMWGRSLGVVFLLPLALFAARGMVSRALGQRLMVVGALGAVQAVVGWYMVTSGLEDPGEAGFITSEPRVSPYRLAMHLTCAFVIYGMLTWTTLSVFQPAKFLHGCTDQAAFLRAKALNRLLHPAMGLLSLTVVAGAYVAGLDAGKGYNTWPLMNGYVIPQGYLGIRTEGGAASWRNLFEDPASVQFHHRCLATTTALAMGAVWLRGMAAGLPQPAPLYLHALAAATLGQFTLGVVTLLNYVPVSLGAAHQAGALVLFSVALANIHLLRTGRLRWDPQLAKVVAATKV